MTFLLTTIIWPSLKHVLGSSVFWLVAVAHSGASMAKSSVRVVGTYLADTAATAAARGGGGDASTNRFFQNNNNQDWMTTFTNTDSASTSTTTGTSGMGVFLSLGTLAGLMVAGHLFAMQSNNQARRRRKWLVSKLYLIMILSCYCLAFLAFPAVTRFLDQDLLLLLQVSALFVLGFGTSVPYYHLPSLVSANNFSLFPCTQQHKALFLSLTEGVAYGIAGWLWNIVGRIVSSGEEGWCYGWACVALLLVLTAFIMVEFLEHYYCRPQEPPSSSFSSTAMYETIVFA